MRSVTALVVLVLAVLLAGCSAADSGGDSSAADEAQPQAPAAGDAVAPEGRGPGPDADGQQSPNLGAGQPVAAVERQVVRTADLRIQVRDLDPAAERARGIPQARGGFLAGESGGSDGVNLTLRVASGQLDAALADLGRLGEVTERSLTAEDVTDQTVDLQARIASQQASVDRLRALLGQAGTIGEVVQVESELTSRQAELESLQQRAAALSGQAALATVTVYLSEPDEATAPPDEDRTGFLWGLTNGLAALAGTAQVVVTVLGALLPFLVVLGVPTLLVMRWLRRRMRTAGPAGPPPAPAAGATGG